MPYELHLKARVLPGNKIEIQHPELSVGETVEVSVFLPKESKSTRRSVIEILNELPGQRQFKTPEEVDKYLQGERDSWHS